MKFQPIKKSSTEYELTVIVTPEILGVAKQHALNKLSKSLKVPGFRQGKVPTNIAEKHIDPNLLQSEFINEAINHSFNEALDASRLNPVVQPSIEVTKFVPFTELEYKIVMWVIGNVTLADYKKINVKKSEVKITSDEVEQVIKNLQIHLATKSEVDRASKKDDQIWIDFEGHDSKGNEVKGASGKDYPLVLGSNTFIPGFEDNLVGLKKEDVKSFTLTFPKDYGVKALQNRKVTFKCTVNKVVEVQLPAVDNELAKKANPNLSTVEELKADIESQLLIERQKQSDIDFENKLIEEIVNSSKVEIPQPLIDEQLSAIKKEFIQNLMYKGTTIQEFLNENKMSEKEHEEKDLLQEAIKRLNAGIILSKIAEAENLTVTPEELELRIQVLKNQYSDEVMRNNLETEDGRRSVASRLLTEKTLSKLKNYVK